MDVLAHSEVRARELVNAFMIKVYNWMAAGLAITGAIAFYVASNEALLRYLVTHQFLFFGLIIAEFVMVIALAGFVRKMSGMTASAVFILYSVLNGVTLSTIFLVYARAAIATTFFISAGTFVACSIYGMTTKRDLTSWGGFLFMGLIGVIIASVVNMFVKSSGLSLAISYIGVFVFIGLTAYDTQKLKTLALSRPADIDSDTEQRGAIIGALTLYLDFINLFLLMLRIFGGGRE
ncbi:MAG: BAX inhibitor (BI)-1/YccA family protein [Deltaproteobacteria bacterium]|nr:MAG: BAX inhibitor (BI)-1/YccA family protein [Deltaproteobacteria bacterium]